MGNLKSATSWNWGETICAIIMSSQVTFTLSNLLLGNWLVVIFVLFCMYVTYWVHKMFRQYRLGDQPQDVPSTEDDIYEAE